MIRSEAANAARGVCREAKQAGGLRPASEGQQIKQRNGSMIRSEAANAARGLCREAKQAGGPRPVSEGAET
jgi:hypothetical protein